jgi:hypothetical protein
MGIGTGEWSRHFLNTDSVVGKRTDVIRWHGGGFGCQINWTKLPDMTPNLTWGTTWSSFAMNHPMMVKFHPGRPASRGTFPGLELGYLEMGQARALMEVTYTFGYSFVAVLQFTIYLYCAELFPTAVRTLGVGVSFFGGFGI